MDSVVLIGYSGHAFVVADILLRQGCTILGYMESAAKEQNPFDLAYLGDEREQHTAAILEHNRFSVAIGENSIREKVYNYLCSMSFKPINAIHPASTIAFGVSLGEGLTIMAGAVINPLVSVATGVIVNTGAIIDHECRIDDFVHVAPGAVLAGNVHIGKSSFIGANSVIKEGISVGRNVMIGAGSVIVKNVPDNTIVYGNPGRIRR